MKLRKQPGCWLRSSHTFKECVIAHWSSEFARKITGAKLYTEIAGAVHLTICTKRESKRKKKDMYILLSVLCGRGAFCSRKKYDRKDVWTRQKRECWNK